MQSRLLSHRTTQIAVLAVILFGASCNFGVQGGAGALSTKFTGISGAVAISPTSVTVNWPTLASYTAYTVYGSNQDSPLVTLHAGSSYTVGGLNPNTSYSFSVVGTTAAGNQYGAAKQMQATTWKNFLGPVAAAAVDSQSVNLTWSFNIGPSFQIYYAAGAPPAISAGTPPQLTTPAYTTSSPNGYTVGGLSPNTTYYFMAAAKYADGTDSFQDSQSAVGAVTAQVVQSGALSILPVITTQGSLLNTVPPIFNITNSLNTYLTSFWLISASGGVHPECGTNLCLPLGSKSGNGLLTATQNLPAGNQTVLIYTNDQITPGLTARMEFSGLNVSVALPNNGLRVVSVTTPSGLSPVPTISTNPISLGPYPVFTVTGAQPSYTTTIYNGATTLGTLTGNGLIKTASSAPLPQGLNTLYAVVTANGQSATINNIQVRVKFTDAGIVQPPAGVNGNTGSQGFGHNLAVGDFNCDGRPDIAVSAPFGNGVYIYYGSPAGLDFSAAPSVTPFAGKPLFISTPPEVNIGYVFYGPQLGQTPSGEGFGISIAAGNFNGAFNVSAATPCSDLVVGSDQSFREGVIVVYYGAPSGLQVTGPVQENSFTCIGGGSYSCTPAYFRPSTSGVPVGPGGYLPFSGYQEGIGFHIAVGDVDGDGYDDIVATSPASDQLTAGGYQGMAFLWRGTANGISPNFTKISLPLSMTTFTGQFGRQAAIGHFMSSPRYVPPAVPGSNPPQYSPTNLPLGPSDVAFSIIGFNATAPGIPQFPNSQSGIVVIQGQSTPPYMKVDAAGIATAYTLIIPPQCNAALITAGWGSGGANCGTSPNSLIAIDLNQDGYDDIVFSNTAVLSPAGTSGAVFAYYGGTMLGAEGAQTTIPSIGNTCSASNCTTPQAFYLSSAVSFGSSLANLGDMNGDGYPELGIGDFGYSPAGANYSGGAYIYHSGSAGLTSTALVRIYPGKTKNSFFGAAMAAGKFNSPIGYADLQSGVAHTYNDLLIGADGESPPNRDPVRKIALSTGSGPLGSQGAGTVSLYTNASPGFSGTLTTPQTVLAPDNVKPINMGADMAVLTGDINGDGFSDVMMQVIVPGPLVFGAIPYPVSQTGFVVYYGSPSGFITSRIIGGVNTLIAPSYNPVNPTDPLFVTNSLMKSGSFNAPTFAHVIAPAGDVNGDGFADVLTMDNYYLGGYGIVFHGSSSGLIVSPTPRKIPYAAGSRPSLDPMIFSSDLMILAMDTPNSMPGQWARATSFGDFNGDGYSDIVIENRSDYDGVAYSTPPISDTIIIYGSKWGLVSDGDIYENRYTPGPFATALPTNKAQITSNCTGSYPYGALGPQLVCTPLIILRTANPGALGVMNAGDMDGDGTDDIVSVNCRDSAWSPSAGTLSIYYGSHAVGIDPNIYVNLRITPKVANRYLGCANFGIHPWNSSSFGRAYDVNGDGLQDIILDSQGEQEAYLIYGVSGGGSSPTATSGAYIGAGMCASYPCIQNITPTPTADFNPIHVLDVDATHPSSCSTATNSCNVMRWPSSMVVNGDGIFGVGDITGDAFGDVVLSRSNVAISGFNNWGIFYIYSGSANGLQVVGAPVTNPNCVNGICDPTIFYPPSNIPQIPANVSEYSPQSYVGPNMFWYSVAGQNPSDVDGDGKRDFLISSQNLKSFDLSGNQNGTATGGFFLFH